MTGAVNCSACGVSRNTGERCNYCGTLYPETIQADQRQNAAPVRSLDSKYHVERKHDGLFIWWNWRGTSVWAFLATCVVWNVVAFRMELLLVKLIGIALIVWVLVNVVNKTTIYVTRQGVKIQHKPVPCRKGFTFQAGDVQQVYVSREQKRSKDRTWHVPALQLVTTDSRRHAILTGESEADFADFETLRLKILSELGIEPRNAVGEHTQ